MNPGDRLRELLEGVEPIDGNAQYRGRIPGTDQIIDFTLGGELWGASPELEAFLAEHGIATAEDPSAEDLQQLLDVTHDFLARFLVMGEDGLRVLTLWVFHTWAIEAAETTPYISIPEPGARVGQDARHRGRLPHHPQPGADRRRVDLRAVPQHREVPLDAPDR